MSHTGRGGGGKCKTRQEMRLKKCKRLEKEIRKRGREEFGSQAWEEGGNQVGVVGVGRGWDF